VIVGLPKAICSGLFFMAALLFAPAVLAQSVNITSYSRSDNGCSADGGSNQYSPCDGINYVACASDVTFDFTLSIDDPNMASDHIAILVGPTDSACIPPAGQTATPGCWPVAKAVGGLSSTMNVTVRAQDIAAQVGNPSPPTTYIRKSSTKVACESQTCPGTVKLFLTFLIEGTNDEVPAGENPAEFDLYVGTLGPQAPANVNASVNDGYVSLTWQAPTESSIAGYYVYCQNFGRIDAAAPGDGSSGAGADACDESPGCVNTTNAGGPTYQCPAASFPSVYTMQACSGTPNVTTTDSGTTVTDAAFDTGTGIPVDGGFVTTGPVTTQSGISQVNAIVASPCPPGKVCLCGSPTDAVDGAMTAGSTTTSATVSAQNFEFYVWGVAAVDVLGNVGPVGNLKCGTPGPIKDFWYNYSTLDGGLAGGGYCALEGVGMPAASACMTAMVGLAAVGLVRRRRRPKRP
jgi:hypothetical protein